MPFVLAAAVGVTAAAAADIYVRPDGSDACDGRADVPAGDGGSCAVRTIERANALAGCGDTVHLAPGDYYEKRISITNSCSAAAPKRFTGAGVGASFWMAGAVSIDDSRCTPDPDHPGVYRCPKGGVATGTSNSPQSCLIQRYTTSVYWEDENGSKGDMVGPVCLTRNTNGAADVAGKEGNYFETATDYWVRPWDDRDPRVAGGVDLIAAAASCTTRSSNGIHITGSNIVLERMTVITPCYQAIGISGRSVTLQDLEVYGGMVWAYTTSSDLTYRRLKVKNAYRRPDNMGTVTGTSWNAASQCMATQARGFTMEDIETYGCREGFSFSGGASNGTVDGLFVHGSYNHGLIVIDTETHDILIRDAVTYNVQEAVFIECPYNITFENCTFPQVASPGCVVIQGNNGCPADRPHNLDFFNNIITCMIWHGYGGDTWAKGGHDLDYNTYISDNGRSWVQRNVSANKSMRLTAWKNWADDPCPDCTRDPHSRTATKAQVYKNWMDRDDRLGAGYDFDLRTDSPVIGTASPEHGDMVDIEGVARSLPKDPGAYAHEEGTGKPACSDGADNDGDGAVDYPEDYGCTSAADTSEVGVRECGDGADNDGDGKIDQDDGNCSGPNDDAENRCGDGVREPGAEECDGADLGGATCSSRGHAAGTLRCTASCTFDESGCNDPPADVENAERGDTQPGG
ncbi:MAG: hypothetical protein D6718_00620 [Acidobacteria bacterium]|nr:MAG: hypothetical protein D6718_00620 [Acidobacteriota bacterium]